MPDTQESLVLRRLDTVLEKIETIGQDVAVLKSKDYDSRLNEIGRIQGSHGERLARTEVRAGYISSFVSAFVAAVIGIFVGR